MRCTPFSTMEGPEDRFGERGFTLLELVLAMAISVLFLVSLLGANIMTQKANAVAQQKTVAMQDATQVLERMRDSATFGLFPANVLATFPNNGTVAGFQNLTGENVSVQYVSTTANPLDVRITVSWVDETLHPVNYSMNSFVTQRE